MIVVAKTDPNAGAKGVSLILVEKGTFVCGRRERTADGVAITRRRHGGGLTGGLWLIGVGCWMLVSQVHLFGLDYSNSWPLFIILSGIIMLIKGLR